MKPTENCKLCTPKKSVTAMYVNSKTRKSFQWNPQGKNRGNLGSIENLN